MSASDCMKAFVLINLLLAAGCVAAQDVYKWVDENGEVHYSQTLPPEQSEKAHDRLTGDGLVAERVDRVRTADELAELEAERAAQQEQAEQERIQAQKDRLFLAAFPTEDDVRRSFESRRENVVSERRSVEGLLEQARSRFAQAVEQAAALERRGEPVPDHLAERIRKAREGIGELDAQLREIDQRLAGLDEELAAELERHRRLTGQG